MNNYKYTSLQFLFITTLFIFWEMVVDFEFIDSFFYSKPSLIIKRVFALLGNVEILEHILITLFEALIGLLIGTILGSSTALIFYNNNLLSKVFIPIFGVLNSLPRIAFAPLIILWFGFGIKSKVIIVISLIFFISFYSVYYQLKDSNIHLSNRIKLINLPLKLKLKHYFIPLMIQGIVKVLRLALAFSIIGAILGEYIGSSRGLGYLISNSGSMFDTTGVFAGLFILIILVIFSNTLISLIESKFKYLNLDNDEMQHY